MRADETAGAGIVVKAGEALSEDGAGAPRRMAVPAVSRWVVMVAVLLASWPEVRWYGARLGDGGDEPWGLVALAVALALTPVAVWRARMSNTGAMGVLVPVLAAWAGAEVLPMMVRAGLVAGALAVAAGGGAGAWGRGGLCVLSLPVLASLQFYAGYPLRVLTAELGRPLLALGGVATERVGTVLGWAGGEVVVDAPCSGVKMLWAGSVLACVLAAAWRMSAGRTVALVMAAVAGMLAANAVRAAILFFVESKLWPAPAWAHGAVGAGVFACAALLVVSLASRWRGGVVSEGRQGPGGVVRWWRRWQVAGCAAMVVAGAVPLCATRLISPAGAEVERGEEDDFPGWPETFEGGPLTPAGRRQGVEFAAGFAGKTGVFEQPGRVVVLRWIRRASRSVHPAADCYRARGYGVKAGGMVRDGAGVSWSEFLAERGVECWRVRERWYDERGGGWTDVSAWWWAAQAAKARGPWWSAAVALKE